MNHDGGAYGLWGLVLIESAFFIIFAFSFTRRLVIEKTGNSERRPLAVPRGAEPPRLKHPPLRVFWFAGRSYTEGIETHKADGIGLRVYSPEKTLADCFKYRNKIGLDTVLEALRFYKSRKRPNVDDLIKFARVCSVEKVLRPYLEAVLYST